MALHEIVSKNGVTVHAAAVDGCGLPLLVYKGAFRGDQLRSARQTFKANGWGAHEWSWGNGLGSSPHFHHNTAEAVCVLRGRADCAFGQKGSLRISAEAGDVIFLPPGLVHAGVGASSDVQTMGTYPQAAPHWTMESASKIGDAAVQASIAAVPVPPDPVFGGVLISVAAAAKK